MKVIIIIVLLSLSFILGSCAQFLRHFTFIQEERPHEVSFLVPGEDFMIVSGDEPKVYGNIEYDHDKGRRTPASSMTKAKARGKAKGKAKLKPRERKRAKELAIKERFLGLFEEREYRKARPYLNGISEKIYYLSLPPPERRDYITGKIGGKRERKKEREKDFLSTMIQGLGPDALYLGMDKKAVLRRWGHPTHMEVAGNPKRQNERWSFYYNGRLRQVYFEGGRVRGWDIDQ